MNTSRPEVECAACVASRRSVVDSFILGFRAGFQASVAAEMQRAAPELPTEAPHFCPEHNAMIIVAYAEEIRRILG